MVVSSQAFPGELRCADAAFERMVNALRRPGPSLTSTVLVFTGMPAPVMAHQARQFAERLGKRLFRVDPGTRGEKFIGETEKNILKQMDKAPSSQFVLFFDEADALFGKRTSVSDAHDRYANVETNYLLSALGRRRGVAILTSNHRSSIDAMRKPGVVQTVVVRFPPCRP